MSGSCFVDAPSHVLARIVVLRGVVELVPNLVRSSTCLYPGQNGEGYKFS